ncbi:MAG: FAD-dependent oxidoreductase [Bdellovibrionota bacterium]
METKYLIIGAGPTGLGAAYRLRELGITDFVVVDASDTAGGLSRSFVDKKGFTWDIGGHVQFSHYAYFDRVMREALSEPQWNRYRRISGVVVGENLVPYPFQNNLRYLPPDLQWKCVQGLLKKDSSIPIHNFADWIKASFGSGIQEIFMQPYNFKVWATPLEQMSREWVGERVASVDLESCLKALILSQDNDTWGPNSYFEFPKKGGTGAIWKRVAELVGESFIKLNHKVVHLDTNTRTAHFANKDKVVFEYCLNTMPIDLLAQMSSECPQELKSKASQLTHTSTHVIGIGLDGRCPDKWKDQCWLYFPGSDCPFYRLTVFSNYSKFNVPNPLANWSVMLEVAESKWKPVNRDTVIQECIQGLKNTGIIAPDASILSSWHMRAHHGYPVPTLDRNELLQGLHPFFEKRNIFSRGRFGGWKYEVSNQDHSFMQGVEWAERLITGASELTYFDPNLVNSCILKKEDKLRIKA